MASHMLRTTPIVPFHPERGPPRTPTLSSGIAASVSAALSPSDEQSLMGQPWSREEKGHAPLLMWR